MPTTGLRTNALEVATVGSRQVMRPLVKKWRRRTAYRVVSRVGALLLLVYLYP
jgi:hypothetical protein